MVKPYYSMAVGGKQATISIYGDITSYPWSESDVSAYNLSKKLDELTDVDEIAVYINSYGGEVAEGLAIYNALKRHKAKVTTYCDGFACSIASVIFAAGDERKMGNASLLMIHNAWTFARGNADELRKQAEDLDKITSASKAAYMEIVNISDVKLKHLMDAETWIIPSEAVEMGFATGIVDESANNVSQSAKQGLFACIMNARKEIKEEEPTVVETVVETPAVESEEEKTEEVTETPVEESEEVTEEREPEQNAEEKSRAKFAWFFNAITKK